MPVTIVTRSGKGSPLTWNELDANFNNLNTGIDNITISYETGTFTPIVVGVSTEGVGTYTSQQGKYTKIGNVVTFSVYLVWTAHTGTGSMRINGMPFQPSATVFPCSVWYNNFLVGSGKQFAAILFSGTSYIAMANCDPAGGAYANVSIDTAGSLALAGSYIAA